MSTLGLDGRNGPPDVAYYAPPKFRAPGTAGIGPLALERLSRGDPQDESSATVPLYGELEQVVLDKPRVEGRFRKTGILTIAIGCVAALAALTITIIRPSAEYARSAVATDEPQPVAVTVKAQAKAPPAPEPSPVAAKPAPPPQPNTDQATDHAAQDSVTQEASPHSAVAGDIALMAPLKLWAMVPADPAPDTWSPVEQPLALASPAEEEATEEQTSKERAAEDRPAKVETTTGASAKADKDLPKHEAAIEPKYEAAIAPKHDATAAKHEAAAQHASQPSKQARRRHHRQRQPQSASTAATQTPEPAQSDAAKPIKVNPIQAAINSFMGR